MLIISRWDLTSHTKVAHNGEKVMCPNCGSCFSKKSNLYNHLHRGKVVIISYNSFSLFQI